MNRPPTGRTSRAWRRIAAWGPVVVALLEVPVWGMPPDPSRLLQQGKFREAQQAYESMAERQPEDPRWRYNAGVAAFKAGDAATAQKHFEAATAASDLDLQRKAWYNLGNASFSRATAPGAEEAEKTLQTAAEAFGAALQLDPKDRAASENLSAVKHFVEELKKQQQDQQSQEGDSDKKDSKDQKNAKDQQGQKGKKGQKGKQNQDAQKDSQEDSKDDASRDPDLNSDQQQASKSKDGKGSKDSKGKKESADARNDDAKNDPAGKDGADGQKDQASQQTNSPAGGSRTNQLSQEKGEKGKAGAKPSDIQRAGGNEAAGADGEAGQSGEEPVRMTLGQAQQMLDSQKGNEKPIWTLVRGWGQEKQENSKSSGRRKNW